MAQNTVTKEALTSVINGLFQSIEAENEEKSQNLIDELCKLYEERGDDSEEACRQLGFTMQMYNAAKALLAKK